VSAHVWFQPVLTLVTWRKQANEDRGTAFLRGAVFKLAVVVGSPAGHPAGREQRESVVELGRHGHGGGDAIDEDGRGSLMHRPVP
jgi:hypothetical protein